MKNQLKKLGILELNNILIKNNLRIDKDYNIFSDKHKKRVVVFDENGIIWHR